MAQEVSSSAGGGGSNEEDIATYTAFLEDQVHRLSVELAELQDRVGISNAGEAIDGNSELAQARGRAPWLVDAHRLAPLVRAYDARLDQQEGEIATLRHQVGELCDEISRLVKENEELAATSRSLQEHVDMNDVDDMRSHVALLLEENRVLLQREQDATAANTRVTASVNQSATDTGLIRERMAKLKADNSRMVNELLSLRKQCAETQRDLAETTEKLKSTQRALADSEAQQMQTNRELDVLKFASTTHVAFAPLAPTASVPHLTHKSNPAGDDMVHKYQALEDEHSEAVRTLAAQDEALRQSARRERKLKKLLTSMVDTTTASEREAQRSALALQKLKAQGKKKDKALQHLVHQLSDSRSEADMTRANATMAVQEAAMIVRGRHKSHGRR
eukprot:m.320036 g.320036  ORF g.320036 m.320036 type:complete len:391 (+) comp20314_c0_seq7:50-1222(+)